jgi:hypothetical protein
MVGFAPVPSPVGVQMLMCAQNSFRKAARLRDLVMFGSAFNVKQYVRILSIALYGAQNSFQKAARLRDLVICGSAFNVKWYGQILSIALYGRAECAALGATCKRYICSTATLLILFFAVVGYPLSLVGVIEACAASGILLKTERFSNIGSTRRFC